ncbi:hypothetical protein SADUNF_Sadunf11G0072300 [Salix dunnii]|uniref:Uncharacterized protein n=1 Tax=Salix dunnii TaxID=1413687 RepID=A0A835JQD2_9ROSI|nr:hypothetical protein SADUNF_Sadunf11G0072300 [Salix dunnii]
MAKRKAKKKSPSPSSHHPPHRQPPSSGSVILGLPSPTKKSSHHSSLPPARPSAVEFPPLAKIVVAPVTTIPSHSSILGKAPLAPVCVELPSSHHSLVDSSSAEDTGEGESSGSETSSCSGDVSELEPMSAPPSPTLMAAKDSAQFPVQGLSSPPSAQILAEGSDAPVPPAHTSVGKTAGASAGLSSETDVGLTVGALDVTTGASEGLRSDSVEGLTVGAASGFLVAADLVVAPSGVAVQLNHTSSASLGLRSVGLL